VIQEFIVMRIIPEIDSNTESHDRGIPAACSGERRHLPETARKAIIAAALARVNQS
jgi:hypothetical protein